MSTIKLAALSAALLTLAPGAALAAGGGESWTPEAAQNRVGMDYELWPAADGFGMVWGLNGHVKVHDKIVVDADYAFGYSSFDFFGGRFKQAAYGNLTGGAHYVDFINPDLSFYVGATLTLPFLHDPTNEVALSAALLTVTRAYVDAYRLVPGSMPLRVGGGIEYRILPNLYYRGSLVPTLYISVRSGVDTDFFIDQVNEIEYRLDMGFGGGLRLQEAFTLTVSDKVQLALEPFVGYQAKDAGLYGRFGLLVALDETAGFGFDRNKLATLRFAGGYHW